MSSTKSGSASGTNATPSQSQIAPSSTAIISTANVVANPNNQVFFVFTRWLILRVSFFVPKSDSSIIILHVEMDWFFTVVRYDRRSIHKFRHGSDYWWSESIQWRTFFCERFK